MDIVAILEYKIITINEYDITPINLIWIFGILVFSKLVLRGLLKVIRKSAFFKSRLDQGRRYALEQFVKYALYTITFLMIVESIGLDLSIIWAGSAALMVGVGLGLQQIFNDLASGVILLIEGEIEAGDVVLVDGTVGKITKIGIRASHIETRDKITMIVPNSKLITSNVSNYGSQTVDNPRFILKVGVAYGSDVPLVKKILLEVASEQELVCKDPEPMVYFSNFGNSSLDFELHFFSPELLFNEKVKSAMRYRIDELFRSNQVQIPFPQQDVWFRNLPAAFTKE